jgi:hypothetical protein
VLEGQKKAEEDPRSGMKDRRAERALSAFKGFVLLLLLGLTAYGMFRRGLYPVELWSPVAAAVMGIFILTLFVRGYYSEIPRIGWVLVGLLGGLVAIKGLSLIWTISRLETVQELLRSSMYLAVFVAALGAVSSLRRASAVTDGAILISVAVAGYGLLQKINPVDYPVTSTSGVRVDSTLQYPNTTALVVGMGALLALGRMTGVKNALARAIYAAMTLILFATLYLTFSRGGLLAAGVGIVALFVLSSNRLQMFANLVLVGGPLGWLYFRIQQLPELTRQGLDPAQRLDAGMAFRNDMLIALAAVFLLQLLYAALARRYELTPGTHRALGAGSLAAVVVAAGVAGYALVGEQVREQGLYDTFTGTVDDSGSGVLDGALGVSGRLDNLSVGHREAYWEVAWQEWRQHPLTGTGAGTFMYTWLQDRPIDTGVKQVHNLYLEQGTETGVFAFAAVVGFALLLAGHVVRGAWTASGERRVLLSALGAVTITYLFSSVFEWHWYIPASTLFFFILAGAAIVVAPHGTVDKG